MTFPQSHPKTAKEVYVRLLLDEIGPLLGKAEEVTAALEKTNSSMEADLSRYNDLIVGFEQSIIKSVDRVAFIINEANEIRRKDFFHNLKLLSGAVLAASVISSIATASFFYVIYENKIKPNSEFNIELVKSQIMKFIEPAALKGNR